MGIYAQYAPFTENPGETPDGVIEPVKYNFQSGSAWGFPGSESFQSPLPMVDIRYSWSSQEPDWLIDYADVYVLNVAPTVEAGSDLTVMAGDKVFFHGSFIDPGTDDTHEIQWNFGDGIFSHGNLNTNHVYKNPGEYTVTLLVVDDDKGGGFDRLTVIVRDQHTIREKIQNLMDMVESLGLPDGIENALVSKLKNALNAFDIGNYKASLNMISAFIAHVGALRGKKISYQQANELIASAIVLRDLLLDKLG
jgi:hypothetical protein